jgi:hypothetical protein
MLVSSGFSVTQVRWATMPVWGCCKGHICRNKPCESGVHDHISCFSFYQLKK